MTIQVFVGAARPVLLGAAIAVYFLAAPLSAGPLTSRYDPADFDASVRPGDDFDAYASGGWRRRATIPPDQESIGTVDDISARGQVQLRQLIESGGRVTKQAKLIRDLYAAYMDEAAVERLDDAPLKADLASLAAIVDKTALAEFMGQTQSRFGKSFFAANVWVGLKQPTLHVLRIDQDGLGMRVREAYLGDGAKAARAAYEDYVAGTLALIGKPDAKRLASDILALELRIAEASWSLVENSDRDKRYNPMTVAELEAFAPGFPWRPYLKGVGAPSLTRLIALQKSAFPRIAAVFADTPLSTIKAWEAFHIADAASPCLSHRFVANAFSFRDKVERGLEQPEPRWKHGVNLVNERLSNAVGYEYVAKYFPPDAKVRAEAMVQHFKTAFKHRIERVTWMTAETKAAAIEKLDRVRVMIGHPDRWLDYNPLTLDRMNLYDSVVRAKAFDWSTELAQLSQPVDPGFWFLSAQAIDAFSDFSRVAIGITAGILQPPLFDPTGDAALNYGGIGEAIGHELTHQFDDQGRKFDARGARNDWWRAEDATRFQEAAARLVTQFNGFEVLTGYRVNGEQTLSENIADLGGLLLALDAYHLSLNGRPAPIIDGLTGDQRVFLAWARVFRIKEREESLRRQAVEGTHTPFKFRAIGPMRNVDAWYDAFGVKPGDRYYVSPADRVRIW